LLDYIDWLTKTKTHGVAIQFTAKIIALVWSNHIEFSVEVQK
jgi:hypothetical protein